MWENALYVGGDDDGVIEAGDLTVGAAVCWEFMRSATARRLRGRVDLVMGGSNWWSIPPWPPAAYTRRAEAANAATAARAPTVFGRYVGAPVVHAATTRAVLLPDARAARSPPTAATSRAARRSPTLKDGSSPGVKAARAPVS